MLLQSSRHYARLALAAAIVCAPLAVFSQELEIAVSPSPVGSGARAAGMADAFVAIADDATAASWNPAGLVQLERPEVSIVGSFNAISEHFAADYLSGFASWQEDANLDLNFFSVAYPLPFLVLGRNVSVALNYQRKYDFSRDFDTTYVLGTGGNDGTTLLTCGHWKFKQEGGVGAVTPALAFELSRRLSLGIALNLWRSSVFGENTWTQDISHKQLSLMGPTVFTPESHSKEEYKDFQGENVTVGFLWNLTNKWNLGGRYDSSFSGKTDYTKHFIGIGNQFASVDYPIGNFNVWSTTERETREVTFPSTFALGLAHRPNDRATVSLDVTRTDWNDFYFEDETGNKISLVDASNLNVLFWKKHFDPTYTIRTGMEYVFIPKEPEEALDHLWTLRGGLFYDQEPATGHPDNFWGVALGGGVLLNQRVNIDIAYQLRYGHGVNSDYIRGVSGFEEDVFQNRLLLSTVIYF